MQLVRLAMAGGSALYGAAVAASAAIYSAAVADSAAVRGTAVAGCAALATSHGWRFSFVWCGHSPICSQHGTAVT